MTSLAGKRILVTRPQAQSVELIDRLTAMGAQPVAFPVIKIVPVTDTTRLDQAVRSMEDFDWIIFTSVNGVRLFWERLQALGKDARLFSRTRVAAIGPVTAQALENNGLKPNFVPNEYVAEAIAAGLGNLKGQRVLLPRADIARKSLADDLLQLGAEVVEIPVYHTIFSKPPPERIAELRGGIDVVTFTSSSTVQGFRAVLQQLAYVLPASTRIACIGPITADTAHALGFSPHIIARQYTIPGLVSALQDYYNNHQISKEKP